MKVNVVFFASLREQLGAESIEVDLADTNTSIADVIKTFTSEWQEILTAPNILAAVNHDLVEHSHQLSDGDELAFLPPVTGG